MSSQVENGVDDCAQPAAAVECIDLCCSDNDDDEPPTTVSTAPSEESAVVDLSSDGNDQAANQQAIVLIDDNGMNRKKRRRNKDPTTAQKKASPSGGADAIAIDVAVGNQPEDSPHVKATMEYRGKVGPFRMGYVAEFTNPKHALSGAAAPGAGHYHHSHQHHYSQQHAGTRQKKDQHKFHTELVEYQLNLPIELSSSIFVRASESNSDLLRALITGPEDTPYENGMFLFDINAANCYRGPPRVKFLTTGKGKVRFNPNLYNCGKVCLSLLGTWEGPGWSSQNSTLLQVLVSIQGLILVPDPYFNEPGYARSRGTPNGDRQSEAYNKNIRKFCLQHAIDPFLTALLNESEPLYGEFRNVIELHFVHQQAAIEAQLDKWTNMDRSIGSLAKKVRGHLTQVVQQYHAQNPIGSASTSAEDAKKPAAPAETICID